MAVVELLLCYGDIWWSDHWTPNYLGPVHMAVFFKQNEVVMTLLDMNAEAEHDNSEHSVLEVIQARRNAELLDRPEIVVALTKPRPRRSARKKKIDMTHFGIPKYLQDKSVNDAELL